MQLQSLSIHTTYSICDDINMPGHKFQLDDKSSTALSRTTRTKFSQSTFPPHTARTQLIAHHDPARRYDDRAQMFRWVSMVWCSGSRRFVASRQLVHEHNLLRIGISNVYIVARPNRMVLTAKHRHLISIARAASLPASSSKATAACDTCGQRAAACRIWAQEYIDCKSLRN